MMPRARVPKASLSILNNKSDQQALPKLGRACLYFKFSFGNEVPGDKIQRDPKNSTGCVLFICSCGITKAKEKTTAGRPRS